MFVNDDPTLEFRITKGVRQGDPLSPFLFIIAMKSLNIDMKIARYKSIFQWVEIPNYGPTISHLFYADDTIFVGD